MSVQFRQYSGHTALAGGAVTIWLHEENILVDEAVTENRTGRVQHEPDRPFSELVGVLPRGGHQSTILQA